MFRNQLTKLALAGSPFKSLELLELRNMMSTAIRSIDGPGNNLAHPAWGSVGQPLYRDAPSQYADGISAPSGDTRPGARDLSNILLEHEHRAEDIFNEHGMSAFVY